MKYIGYKALIKVLDWFLNYSRIDSSIHIDKPSSWNGI